MDIFLSIHFKKDGSQDVNRIQVATHTANEISNVLETTHA